MNDFSYMGELAAYGEYTSDVPLRGKRVYEWKNEVAEARSGYVRGHGADPVGWREWTSAVFEDARRYNMPVFVHVGYSWSHWCEVMSRDVWSSVEVAGLINDWCIPVCVDGDERSDVARFAREVCLAANESIGWPVNMFLTPEGEVFLCVTWLPLRRLGSVPGVTELFPAVKWMWKMQKDDVTREALQLKTALLERTSQLSNTAHAHLARSAPSALNDLRSVFDSRWGGFGTGSKWAEAEKLIFLLHQASAQSSASRNDKSNALTMTDITLRRMWRGGIHDHLGGGFSRYSVDERWHVPHFEKLLCDQALLLFAVSMAEQVRSGSFNRLFAEDIIFCALRYFADDVSYSQGFRTSINGDTSDGEGRYYLWTEEEVRAVLPEEYCGLFCSAYGVLPSGNFSSEVAGAQLGQNVLYEASTVSELARRFALPGSQITALLSDCRRNLLNYRDGRFPLKADKQILASTNSLMIGALARAASAFKSPEWLDIAERTGIFITKNFRTKDMKSGQLLHAWQNGTPYIPANLDDLAYFLWAVIELYNSLLSLKPDSRKQLDEWLTCATQTANTLMNSPLWDSENGGFFLYNNPEAPALMRKFKDARDINSLPNPNAIAAIAFNELAHITDNQDYSRTARKIIDAFSGYAASHPTECLTMITASQLFRPLKRKPVIAPKPAPTDEELNREEPPVNAPETATPETPARTRTSRRTNRTESAQSSTGARERRRSRTPRNRGN